MKLKVFLKIGIINDDIGINMMFVYIFLYDLTARCGFSRCAGKRLFQMQDLKKIIKLMLRIN